MLLVMAHGSEGVGLVSEEFGGIRSGIGSRGLVVEGFKIAGPNDTL